jgi:tRNA-uridine 2-sulfurtransferase
MVRQITVCLFQRLCTTYKWEGSRDVSRYQIWYKRGMKEKSKGTVYVGLSGGVDSSVSAALLLQEGFAVVGVFIKVWQPDFLTCSWREERQDAMRVCAHLGIPFHTLDLSKEYKKEVVDYMLAEYKEGRTPNPDVMCNKVVKFGGFLTWARAHGADFIATGHYAQKREVLTHNDVSTSTGADTHYTLSTSLDTHKDQTYFLWTLTQEHLAHTIFPIGHLEKKEVREKAREYGLLTAEKKDSQGICFLGKVSMRDFLTHYLPPKEGDVLNTEGDVIGVHEGAHLYTLGQRHGFTILPSYQGTDDPPLFIVDKDIRKNTLTVIAHIADKEGQKERAGQTRVTITKANWVSGTPKVGKGTRYHARFRYQQALLPVHVEEVSTEEHTAYITFAEPQHYIASGQSLVLYEGEVCLGGGVVQ